MKKKTLKRLIKYLIFITIFLFSLKFFQFAEGASISNGIECVITAGAEKLRFWSYDKIIKENIIPLMPQQCLLYSGSASALCGCEEQVANDAIKVEAIKHCKQYGKWGDFSPYLEKLNPTAFEYLCSDVKETHSDELFKNSNPCPSSLRNHFSDIICPKKIFPKLPQVTCNPIVTSANMWSYEKIMTEVIFPKRGFLCRIFGLDCYDEAITSDPIKTAIMNEWNNNGIGGNFFPYLRQFNTEAFKYFCSKKIYEVPSQLYNEQPCPSTLRVEAPDTANTCRGI